MTVTGSDTTPPMTVALSFDVELGQFVTENLIDWPIGDYEIVVKIDGGLSSGSIARNFVCMTRQ